METTPQPTSNPRNMDLETYGRWLSCSPRPFLRSSLGFCVYHVVSSWHNICRSQPNIGGDFWHAAVCGSPRNQCAPMDVTAPGISNGRRCRYQAQKRWKDKSYFNSGIVARWACSKCSIFFQLSVWAPCSCIAAPRSQEMSKAQCWVSLLHLKMLIAPRYRTHQSVAGWNRGG